MTSQIICFASQRVLGWMLHIAPTRLRDWGAAMLAELEAIDHPVESLHWSLGCLGIILREALVNAFLGSFRSTGSWITAKGEDSGMRSLRIAAVSALIVVLGFFIAPSFRQAMSIASDTFSSASWALGRRIEGRWMPGDTSALWLNSGSMQRELNRLRVNAERERDAKMLAYVALHDDQLQVAGQDTDHAVAIDPQWTWVYYVLASRDMTENRRSGPTAQSALWSDKLRQWDPQNAVTYLLDAERFAKSLDPKKIAQDKLWVEMMTRAVDSPKYDSYFRQRFNLERDIARQWGIGDPLRLRASMESHPVPSVMGRLQYERFILSNAKNPSDLAQQAKRVIAFGERMTATDDDFDQIIGLSIALDGYHKLQPLAPPADQVFIGAQIAQLKSTRLAGRSSRLVVVHALVANAVIVEVSFVLILLATMTMAGSAAVFVFRRARRMRPSRAISVVSYAAVGTMLVACIVGFIAYLPYSQLIVQAMDPRTPVKVSLPLLDTLLSFTVGPLELLDKTPGNLYVWVYWIVLLTVLSLLAWWIVVRQFRRPRAHTPVVSAG